MYLNYVLEICIYIIEIDIDVLYLIICRTTWTRIWMQCGTLFLWAQVQTWHGHKE